MTKFVCPINSKQEPALFKPYPQARHSDHAFEGSELSSALRYEETLDDLKGVLGEEGATAMRLKDKIQANVLPRMMKAALADRSIDRQADRWIDT